MKLREPRQKVLIQARVRAGSSWSDAHIVNMSSRGMLVQSQTTPKRGSYLEIRRGPHAIVARVIWADSGRFGVRTQDCVYAADLLANKVTAIARKSATVVTERRAEARNGTDHELNRFKARTFQFATLIALALAAASLAITLVREVLASPLQAVDTVLS